MRLVIDLQGAQSGSRLRGIGRYCISLTKNLAKLRKKNEVFIILNSAFADTIAPIRSVFSEILPPENILTWSCPLPVNRIESNNDDKRLASEILREHLLSSLSPDWVIVSSLFEGLEDNFVTSVKKTTNFRTAVILYDLIPWIHQSLYLADENVFSWYSGKIDDLRRSDILLAISESSAQEAINYLGFAKNEVYNISTAANSFFKPYDVTDNEREKISKRYEIRGSFVLYTGGIDYRKNIETLLDAWSILPNNLRQKFQLAIVCSVQDQQKEALIKRGISLGLGLNDVVFTGFVPDKDLLILYNICELFVFPSWHEGFGLPVLEAMQCGKPVLASNKTSLPEVVGRNDVLFDPFDAQSIADLLEKGLTCPTWLKDLSDYGIKQAQNFSWEKTASRTWDILEKNTKQSCPNTCGLVGFLSRPKLAYFSPMPPDQSGIADYSAELLRDLTRWYDIDVVMNDTCVLSDTYVSSVCKSILVKDFLKQVYHYDRILYHFGNSQFHEHMFDLLKKHPGVVVLHDFFLSGILHCSEYNQWRKYAWTSSLYKSHGYQSVIERYKNENVAEVIERYPANILVLQQSLGIIVHSNHAVEMAKNYYGTDAVNDWKVIPLLKVPPLAINGKSVRSRLELNDDAIVFCCFGMLSETKLNHRILDVWLSSPLAANKKFILVFVGLASGDYGDFINRKIQKSDFPDRIKITGWVDKNIYNDWLSIADVAIQLRAKSRGEMSAAVLDCLNNGVATIVNSHGSMTEINSNCVWKIPDNFSNLDLGIAIETLAEDDTRRELLGKAGQLIIQKEHNPRKCSELYFKAIEQFYQNSESGSKGVVCSLKNFPNSLKIELAHYLSCNFPPKPRLLQIMIDVTSIINSDFICDIDDMLQEILSVLLNDHPAGYVVEPIFAETESSLYRYARQWTCDYLGVPKDWAEDNIVQAWRGDIFFGLCSHLKAEKLYNNQLHDWSNNGVKIYCLRHDFQDWFLNFTQASGEN